MRMLLVLFLACVASIAAQSTLTVIPNPTTSECLTASYTNSFPSPGYVNVEITSNLGAYDSFQWGPKSTGDISIVTNAYSSDKPNIVLDITNSSHMSALRVNIKTASGKASFNDETTCTSRTVVVVSVPDSVLFVCFNGDCFCNCAIKGAALNIHFMSPQAGEMDMISAAGFGYSRMDFSWSSIETQPGQYDFSGYDALFASYVPYNITAYSILDYNCPFYDNGQSPQSPGGIQAFANFASAATTRYAGKGYVWELYNEPNIFFWTPSPNVVQYITMGLQVGKQVKAVTPREIFIGPAIASVGYAPSVIDTGFLSACLEGGMLEWWDAVSVHLYRFANPETVLDEYRQVRAMISTYLPADKLHVGLISGEWGYSTTWSGITEDVQGIYHVREMLFNLGNEIPISIWYDWTDDGTDPTNQEDNFGLVYNQYNPNQNPVYNPKSSYIGRQVMQKIIGGMHFNKRLMVNGNTDIYVYLFNTAGADDYVIAAWTSDATNYTVQVPSSDNCTFSLTTTYGEQTSTITSSNGYVEISVSDHPVYLASTSANAFLDLIAATTRLLPEYRVYEGSVTLEWNMPNPTKTSVVVGYNSSNAAKLNPGDTAFFSQEISVANSGNYIDTIVDIYTSLGSFSMYTAVATMPLTIAILPTSPAFVTVNLGNPSAVAFNGFVTLSTNGSVTTEQSSQVIAMPQGQTIISFPFKLGSGTAVGIYNVYVTILDENKNVVLTGTSTLQFTDDYSRFSGAGYPTAYQLLPDGDPNVASTQTMVIVTPEGGPENITTIELSFAMDSGWKFWRVVPSGFAITMSSVPASMSCWVYSTEPDLADSLELRVIDSTGQTFQFQYQIVTFVGWNFVTLPVVSNNNFWGGANDGVFHLPLTFDDVFLFDTTRQAQAGVVYFSAPAIIY